MLALVARNASSIIAVFVLLSLMKGWADGARGGGISACRITHQTQREDHTLLHDEYSGNYQLICIGPEFVDPSNVNVSRILHSWKINRDPCSRGPLMLHQLRCLPLLGQFTLIHSPQATISSEIRSSWASWGPVFDCASDGSIMDSKFTSPAHHSDIVVDAPAVKTFQRSA